MSNLEALVDGYVEEEGIDQNESTAGGTGNYTPPAEGRAMARIVSYIELGSHYGTYLGKPKAKPDRLVRIVIELFGKNYPPTDLEGGVKIPQRLTLNLTLSDKDNSRFYKLFRALNAQAGDKYKHFAQMAVANFAFVVVISHNSSGEGENKRTFANIWKDGAWQVQKAVKYDDDEQEIPMNVPAAISDTKVFLFNKPTADTWASLFIEGERDGKSNNQVQEKILNAVNYPGSALQALLSELPETEADAPAKPKGDEKPAAKKAAKSNAKADDLGDI